MVSRRPAFATKTGSSCVLRSSEEEPPKNQLSAGNNNNNRWIRLSAGPFVALFCCCCRSSIELGLVLPRLDPVPADGCTRFRLRGPLGQGARKPAGLERPWPSGSGGGRPELLFKERNLVRLVFRAAPVFFSFCCVKCWNGLSGWSTRGRKGRKWTRNGEKVGFNFQRVIDKSFTKFHFSREVH